MRREGYGEMKVEILGALRGAGDLDGFLFDVHGAMSVEGIDDAELDLLRGVRKVIGPDLPVACSEALHGNVSAALVAETVDYTRLQRPMFPLDRKFGWEPKVTVLG